MRTFLAAPILCLRSYASAVYAKRRNAPGMEFDTFGRKTGLRLLFKGSRVGAELLLTPVNITRYFEFPFALSCLPRLSRRCLDVSSPRLFSLYVASHWPDTFITMINPDTTDLQQSARVVAKLGLRNISLHRRGVESLSDEKNRYDCIWSISVVEHICGPCDDSLAMQLMYGALRPRGRLIVTVPVDRQFWSEYRNVDYYGTQEKGEDGLYFFQRFYDSHAIENRLIRPTGKQATVIRWFGEKEVGRFAAYIQQWINRGYFCTVDDPREIANYYREFPSWEDMPGQGVCGFVIEKD